MSTSFTTEVNPTIQCECDELVRSTCRGESRYEKDGRHYCVFHLPDPEKTEDFNKALKEKLEKEDFNFRGVYFPEVSFYKFNFSETADFSDAIFSGRTDFRKAVFSNGASFCRTQFPDGADFSSATFLGLVMIFHEATFGATTLFIASTFSCDAQFIAANFNNTAAFYNAKFDSANFERAKFQVARFVGAKFKLADFSSATFSETADFRRAVFDGDATFKESIFNAEANFYDAAFSLGAAFCNATFRKSANFGSVRFGGDWDPGDMGDMHRKDANFERATFDEDASFVCAFSSEAMFRSVTFNQAVHFCASFKGRAIFTSSVFKASTNFKYSTFSSSADFSHATFADYVKFEGLEDKCVFLTTYSLDLQSARFDKPERTSFHSLTLYPHFFVGVDARKFGFTTVKWIWSGTRKEIEYVKNRSVSSPNAQLSIACRQLAVNAEENDRYEDASMFRYMSMDVERQEKWRGFPVWRLSWWYWLASGFGERMPRAFLVLLGILLLSALVYTQVGFARWEPRLGSEADLISAKRDEVGAPMKLSRALPYSLAVMTLQRPEPRPATFVAQAMVLLETILGPVQAALLALAIRRKFMR